MNPSIVAWYLTDHLGSVRGIMEASGSLLDVIVYGAFGNVLSESNPGAGDRYGFTGRELDVITGFQSSRSRQYAPSVGRFTSEDRLGFAASDLDLFRYVGNNPVIAVDPSGYEKITVDPHPDYKNYPLDVVDFYALLYDFLLSGNPKEGVQNMANPLLGQVFDTPTFYDAMSKTCEKKLGAGWTPIPLEFRLTGLSFYPTTQSGGGIAQPPRYGTIKVPVVFKKPGQKPQYTVEEITARVPLGHFFIKGYWVFQCCNKDKKSGKYGIPTEGKVHTFTHAPYDQAFASQMAKIREKYDKLKADKAIEWYYIGRAYDRSLPDMKENSMLKIGEDLSQYLKVVPGDTGNDLTIVTLPEIYGPGFKFHK